MNEEVDPVNHDAEEQHDGLVHFKSQLFDFLLAGCVVQRERSAVAIFTEAWEEVVEEARKIVENPHVAVEKIIACRHRSCVWKWVRAWNDDLISVFKNSYMFFNY